MYVTTYLCCHHNQLYPFGPLLSDESLHDNESSPAIVLDELFFFYDEAIDSVYVSQQHLQVHIYTYVRTYSYVCIL